MFLDGRPESRSGEDLRVYIENPLQGRSREELEEDVARFWHQHDLAPVIKLELLQRGARVAQNPRIFEAIEDLTVEEKQALRDEDTRMFKQPFALWLTIACTSIAAALQGWDQTGSNAANLKFPPALGLHINNDDTSKNWRDIWIFGLVNAAPYFSSAFLGCWLSDPLNNYVGRRGTIFFAAIFCFASVIGSAFVHTWLQLFFCRCLLGIGMGSKASTVPVYAAENSPAFFRGSFLVSWQLWVAFGTFLGFSANLVVYNIGDIGWRLQLGSAFIPAVPLLILIWYAPESPRWYIKQRCYPQAYGSLVRLRNVPLQAARDLYAMHRPHPRTPVAKDIHKAAQYARRFVQLFTIKRVRRATVAACTVMLAQQMCGVNIVVFYSGTLFTDAKASEITALLVSWGFGLVNFVFTLPAVYQIDTLGRRTLLLLTFPGMALTLLGAGFSFYITPREVHLGMIIFFVFLFATFYSPGEGPVPFTYAAEVFPLSHREVGMSLSVATNLFFAGVLTLVFPRMTAALGNTGALSFFAGLNVVAFAMIFLWVPETKQRTLEEMDSIFNESTRTHMKYQITKFLPWMWDKYIRRKDVELAPLYVFRR
ncbi:uncharacterized protein K452DRAFT_272874 [Aplosporella prunicola CBS 121167]|uniref:Major facilitator superfamily (MFS) profile domain-containing protein n=1 Tax=Aplosporella prunicola CBS 121167 TaxID=1176127 RepID=A0A6A6BBS4_9PEZI|nr:uncharacterized protein K452DRAFT_272874 [Aplosporella prunicola CBS 121167]KAF2141058.1 hypothetical protein K452DRAFT_272874 [Aplosporella prunicola CBS 121167]